MDAIINRIPLEVRQNSIYLFLCVVLGAAAFTAGYLFAPDTITKTKKVEKSWGTPDSSIPGAQLNKGLVGLMCDVYVARKAVVCQP